MDLHEAYIRRRQAELAELDAVIKTVEFKANGRTDQQAQFYDDLQALRAQYSKTQDKLCELRESVHEKWAEVKQDLENAWKDLQNGMQRAQRSLR